MSDQWFQLVNLTMAVLNFLVASILVLRGLRASREIGAASVTSAAQATYESLLDTRRAVLTPDDADRYYDRFWSAQALQYEQWRRRLLPDAIYWDWMMHRRDRFEADPELAGQSFRDGWATRFEARYQHTRFGAFMERVLTSTAPEGAAAPHVRRLMRRERWRPVD